MKKYLNIKLAGHDYLAAFKNEAKTDAKQPDYSGHGIAVWVREYDETKSKVAEQPKPKVEEEKVL